MTKDELELKKNVHRVSCNLLVLLSEGLFQGKHALALEECKGIVTKWAEEARKDLEPRPEPVPKPDNSEPLPVPITPALH